MDTVARIYFTESETKVDISNGTRISHLASILVGLLRLKHESTTKALNNYENKSDPLYDFIRKLRVGIAMEAAPIFDIAHKFDILLRDCKTIVDSLFSKVDLGIKVVNSLNTKEKGLLLVHLQNPEEREELERRKKEQEDYDGLDLYKDVSQYNKVRHSKRGVKLSSDGYIYLKDEKIGKIFSAVCLRDPKKDKYFTLMNNKTCWVLYDNHVGSTVQSCIGSISFDLFLEHAVLCAFETLG